jgi:hypothetical protein
MRDGDGVDGAGGARARRLFFCSARLLTATAIAVCLVARDRWGSALAGPVDFFAYLTVQSNVAFGVTAVVGGIIAVRSGLDHPRLDAVRVVVLTFIVTAGVLFALIVQQSGVRGVRVDVPWSDVALHFVLPVLGVVEWILAPRRRRVSFRVLLLIIGYPVVWGVLTLVRGSIVGWYPYYFLDPAQISGPVEFIALSALMLAVFALIGLILIVVVPPRRTGSALTPRTVRASRGPSG